MVTTVGMQGQFSDVIHELLELEYDALEAYKLALTKLEEEKHQEKIEQFTNDHQRHVDELTGLLKSHNAKVPSGPDMKQWLTKGKVALSSMFDEEAILNAMCSNETDTNTAYERILNRADIWDDARDILQRAFADEKRHKAWLEAEIAAFEISD